MARGHYDAYGFIDRLPASSFMTDTERQEAADLLQPGLEAIGPGVRPQDTVEFSEWADYMGMSVNDSDFWEAFRDWYGENG